MSSTAAEQTDTPLTVEESQDLIRSLTDGLVNVVDKTGEFMLLRESSRFGAEGGR